MNEIQMVTNLHPLVATGIVLSCLWAGAYIFSWLIQWSWAWVDESKVGKGNWIVNLLEGAIIPELPPLPDGWVREDMYYMYYKYDETGTILDKTDSLSRILIDDKEYKEYQRILLIRKQSSDIKRYFWLLPLVWFTMFSLWVWYISMWVVMGIALAYTMRMARRGQKLLTKHINDKDAHK